MAKKLKVKKRSGDVVDYPAKAVKSTIQKAGYTGNLAIKTAAGVLREAGKLAKGGVITFTNLEKAVVKSINNTNRLVMNNVQKATKKILK